MMIEETALSEKQEYALAAMMSQPTIRDAASLSGISESTIYRWKRDEPAFREAYRAARRDAIAQARKSLEGLAQTARDTLEDVMRDATAPHAARVSAARTVWQLIDRHEDYDEIEELLAELREDD
jgi:transcriptional regulator with XRE-family HTH domain